MFKITIFIWYLIFNILHICDLKGWSQSDPSSSRLRPPPWHQKASRTKKESIRFRKRSAIHSFIIYLFHSYYFGTSLHFFIPLKLIFNSLPPSLHSHLITLRLSYLLTLLPLSPPSCLTFQIIHHDLLRSVNGICWESCIWMSDE